MCAHKALHQLMAGVDDSRDRFKKTTSFFPFYSKKQQNMKSFLCVNLSSPHSGQSFFSLGSLTFFFFFFSFNFSAFALFRFLSVNVVLIELNMEEQ